MNNSTKLHPGAMTTIYDSPLLVQVMSHIVTLLRYCTLCCSHILLMQAIYNCALIIFLCYPLILVMVCLISALCTVIINVSCSHILMQAMYFVMKMFVCYLFSDGMSRSGVFITCMSEIERVKVEGAVDIFQTVKAARTQRPHMVYTSVSYCQNFEVKLPAKDVHVLSLASILS